MEGTGKFRRIPKGAAAPTRKPPRLAERLEEWLVLWGDWVRAYRGDNYSHSSFEPYEFRDVPSPRQWESTLEVLESLKLETRTLRGLDACIGGLASSHYIVLHWQYARAYWRRNLPDTLGLNKLPADGTPEYEALLDAAREALAAAVVRTGVIVEE